MKTIEPLVKFEHIPATVAVCLPITSKTDDALCGLKSVKPTNQPTNQPTMKAVYRYTPDRYGSCLLKNEQHIQYF